MESNRKSEREMLADAAAHLQLALELLDRACAPAQIGAHVDLAVHELQQEVHRAMPHEPQSPMRSGQGLH